MDFLFLSKLLPLLIYPVALSCILLLYTLLFGKKRSRFRLFPVLLAWLILFTAGNEWVSRSLVQSLEWQNLPSEIPSAEAIVVLGGSTYGVAEPRVIPEINEHGDRLLYAAKLYRDNKAPLIILSGGRIPWFGNTVSEAEDMATLLVELLGVPKSAIILESDSLNTYQNAVYTKKILEERGIERVLLVTSALHMPRSLAIFAKQNITAIAAPTDFTVTNENLEATNIQTKILSLIPSSGSLDRTTNALKEYIGLVIYRLKGWL